MEHRVKEKSTRYMFRDKKQTNNPPTHKKQSPHETGTLILYFFFKEPTPDRFFYLNVKVFFKKKIEKKVCMTLL